MDPVGQQTLWGGLYQDGTFQQQHGLGQGYCQVELVENCLPQTHHTGSPACENLFTSVDDRLGFLDGWIRHWHVSLEDPRVGPALLSWHQQPLGGRGMHPETFASLRNHPSMGAVDVL
jgi:hypothetical protein